jgi:protein SCO1/2
MENLRRVRSQAGPLGRRMRVIAVSVDPAGDTPQVVREFLRTRRVGAFVDYLIGSRAQLERVWADWQIARGVPKDDPELVEHSGLIYGVTSGGELATAYPVGFEAAAIVRDLPLLAEG